jgi:hypothetical protein
MVAYQTRMPMGFVGLLTRDPQAAVVETRFISSTGTVPTGFGQFVIDDASGNMEAFSVSPTASNIVGMLIRPFPTQSLGSTFSAFGTQAPTAGQQANMLRQGYVAVAVQYGTPSADGTVYIRLDTGGHGGTVGGLEATSDSSHNAAVTGARWTGAGLDANGNAELAYNM